MIKINAGDRIYESCEVIGQYWIHRKRLDLFPTFGYRSCLVIRFKREIIGKPFRDFRLAIVEVNGNYYFYRISYHYCEAMHIYEGDVPAHWEAPTITDIQSVMDQLAIV